MKSFGTGPVRTQSVVDRVPLLQHVQSFTLFLDAIWLTQMGTLVDRYDESAGMCNGAIPSKKYAIPRIVYQSLAMCDVTVYWDKHRSAGIHFRVL